MGTLKTQTDRRRLGHPAAERACGSPSRRGAVRDTQTGMLCQRRIVLKMVILIWLIFCITLAPSVRGQTKSRRANASALGEPKSAAWFPRNWVRGYADIGFAPSHNEPDLGRCKFPQPAGSGGMQSPCTAYARYLFSGYVEIQPLNRTIARHVFIFLEPKFSFGNNIPQLKYTASTEPIAFDRSVGVGIKLPKRFELRVAQHQVDYLGRYAKSLGPADLHTNGPYGLFATVGVRWYFGGYDGAGRGF